MTTGNTMDRSAVPKTSRAKIPGIHAEPELIAELKKLMSAADCSQAEADLLLARIAWSRLAETSDKIAGEMIRSLGVLESLNLLIAGESVTRIGNRLKSTDVHLSASMLSQALTRWAARLDRAQTVRDIHNGTNALLRACTPEEGPWPSSLLDLGPSAPIMLWVKGDPETLSVPSVGVVGARAATGYGAQITAELVAGICENGLAIISGAAYGIDAVAHRTALAVEAKTVAVLAGGADHAYPASHDALINKIGVTGAVCSEMVPGSAPTRWRFLQRNRLISALALGVLVTEAGVRSGSLNTAGHAAELGRPLGAVPGPITSPASAGCHKLLREYEAAVITRHTDVIEMIGFEPMPGVSTLQNDDQGEESERQLSWHRRVIDALPLQGVRTVAEIAKESGLSESECRGVLAELDVLGSVRSEDTYGQLERTWSLKRFA